MEQLLFNSLPMLFFMYDKSGVFLDILGGNEPKRVENAKKNIGLHVSEVFEPQMARQFMEKFTIVLTNKQPINFTYGLCLDDFKDKNHTELLPTKHWFEVILTPTLNAEGEVERLFWAQFSIQNYKEQMERLKEERTAFKSLAMKDDLTGLYNRRYLYKKLQEKLDCVKSNKNINKSVLSINIDNLSSINKNLGLFEGDKTIECLSEELRIYFSNIGICTRFRENTFIVILNDSNIEASEIHAEIFRKTIETKDFKEHPKFTVSIGITEIRRSDDSIEDVLERSEEALFYAKKSGKNRCYSTLI